MWYPDYKTSLLRLLRRLAAVEYHKGLTVKCRGFNRHQTLAAHHFGNSEKLNAVIPVLEELL